MDLHTFVSHILSMSLRIPSLFYLVSVTDLVYEQLVCI